MRRRSFNWRLALTTYRILRSLAGIHTVCTDGWRITRSRSRHHRPATRRQLRRLNDLPFHGRARSVASVHLLQNERGVVLILEQHALRDAQFWHTRFRARSSSSSRRLGRWRLGGSGIYDFEEMSD